MKTIGIIGAMDAEINILKSKMNIVATKNNAGIDYHVGSFQGSNITIAKCGIGKVNAAICTQVMIDMYAVDYVINIGVAGAVSKDLKIGDVVISSDLLQHDYDSTDVGDKLGVIPNMGTETFMADEELIRLAKEAGNEVLSNEHNIFVGRIATGDQFISSKEAKERIWTNFKALCAEMEGGAIAHTCYLNNLPFVVVRAISDQADEEAGMSFEKFVPIAAKNSSDIVEHMIKVM